MAIIFYIIVLGIYKKQIMIAFLWHMASFAT